METLISREALSAAIMPVQRRDVTSLVVERLRTLLEKGFLKAGSKLPTEAEMTKLLEVSRPSLRQAYKALNMLGILRAVPGDGTYINESISETLAMPLTFLLLMKKISLADVFELRMMLECELARLAAMRTSAEEIRLIKIQLDKMAVNLGEDQTHTYLEAEYEFHNCIARAAHNNLLLEIVVIVSGLLWETRKRLVRLVPSLKEDFAQHGDIYSAISAREPAASADAMRRHLRTALELLHGEGGTPGALSTITQDTKTNK